VRRAFLAEEKKYVTELMLKIKPTMVSRNEKALRSIILFQFSHSIRQLGLVYSSMILFIPRRRLQSIFKRTKQASLICEGGRIRISTMKT
jgi:hypothetical protein